MLIMAVMGVISMSTQFFCMLVGIESRSRDFGNEPKKKFLILYFILYFIFHFIFHLCLCISGSSDILR